MPKPINLSASRGAAILGLSEYSTPLQVWLEIMESRDPGFCERNNYELPEFEYNAPMRWGHAFENSVIGLAERKADCKIINREEKCTHESLKYITCHIDGEYTDMITGHEGKTTSNQYFYSAFGEPGTDRVPLSYQIQVQHQLLCKPRWNQVKLSVLVFPKRVEEWEAMGWEAQNRGDKYWLFNPGKGGKYDEIPPIEWASVLDEMGYFHTYEITPHAELQALMLEKYRRFWEDNVLGKTPPEPVNYDDIRAIYRDPVGTIVASPEVERLYAEYKNIGAEILPSGPLAKRREQIKTELIKYMADTAGITDEDSGDKWILRGQDGKKLASYGKDKNGALRFR